MLYITQLIYIKTGATAAFEEFERHAIPLIAQHGGTLLLRIRPEQTAFIEGTMENPYEIHLVSFPEETAFENFKKDPERQRFLHLKEQSIESVLLLQGTKI